jgi:hypothetical protein
LFATDLPTSIVTGSVETDNLQRADQTKPIAIANDSDEPPLSIAESSEQTLALITVSASSLPDLGENSPEIVDISKFNDSEDPR